MTTQERRAITLMIGFAAVNRGESVFVIVICCLASADKGSEFHPALRVEEGQKGSRLHFSNNRSKEGAYADHCAGRRRPQYPDFVIHRILKLRDTGTPVILMVHPHLDRI